jgi:hypothetical protein
MIDIATVVHQEDIAALNLQAQSIELYCQNIGLRTIYVIINDETADITEPIDYTWWGSLAPHVMVLPRTAFSSRWVDNGWVSQQAYKMLAASMSYNTYTMVLDAKTIFIKPLTITDLVATDGRLRVGRVPIYPVFETSRDITEKCFDIKLNEQLGPGGVPFFFHNDTVRFMIAETTFRTHSCFPEWFQSQGMLTEFIFYSGYVQHRYGSLDALYSPDRGIHPVNICHSEVARFEDKLREMQLPDTNTVSVHRRAWDNLDSEQQHRYRQFLIEHDVYQAWKM